MLLIRGGSMKYKINNKYFRKPLQQFQMPSALQRLILTDEMKIFLNYALERNRSKERTNDKHGKD